MFGKNFFNSLLIFFFFVKGLKVQNIKNERRRNQNLIKLTSM